jgi:hypothetical protein
MSCGCGNPNGSAPIVNGTVFYPISSSIVGTPIGGPASPSPPTVAGAVSPSAPANATTAQEALFRGLPQQRLGLRAGLPESSPPTVGGGFYPPAWLTWLLAAIGLAVVIGYILRRA